MIIRVTDGSGNTAYIDNDGQVNGNVRIQGDVPLVSHLDRIFKATCLPFHTQRNMIDEKMLLQEEGKHPEIYKASDYYIKNHFIPVECPAFGYSVEILKE